MCFAIIEERERGQKLPLKFFECEGVIEAGGMEEGDGGHNKLKCHR